MTSTSGSSGMLVTVRRLPLTLGLETFPRDPRRRLLGRLLRASLAGAVVGPSEGDRGEEPLVVVGALVADVIARQLFGGARRELLEARLVVPPAGTGGLLPDARLEDCEHDTRRVTRRELDGSLTVLANSFQGRRLNRPNDVVVKSDGAIYFTDPWTGPSVQGPPGENDLTVNGVYRISPDRGTVTLLVDDFLGPNGLAFSHDEKVLYICDSQRRHIRAFEVAPNGTLMRQTDRVFADLGGGEPGVPDGMKVDSAGNVYCGGAGGLYILSPSGKKLGRIVHGFANTANVAFGGDDWKTVYFCTRASLGMFKVKIAGVPVPTPKKS